MKRILFVCSRNRWRSPTAEEIFASHPGVETASAGTAPDADNPLSAELVEWADLIVAMEPAHLRRIKAGFGRYLDKVRTVSLNVPDKYRYMDEKLVEILRERMRPHLPD